MQEKVEQYLKKVEQMETQNRQLEEKVTAVKEANYRNRVLSNVNLIEREYSDKKEFSSDYPYFDKETNHYYRAVPMKVSEEEWEAIKTAYEKEKKLKAQPSETASQTSEYVDNAVAKALKVIAILIFSVGFFGSVCCGMAFPSVSYTYYGNARESYNWGLAIGGILASSISGCLLLGFAELIKLTDNISDNLTELKELIGKVINARSESEAKKED